MALAIKAEVGGLRAGTFMFTAQKTMYGGKLVAEGDTIFVFASENEGGQGLAARKRNDPAHRAREAQVGAQQAKGFRRLGRRTSRDRAQF